MGLRLPFLGLLLLAAPNLSRAESCASGILRKWSDFPQLGNYLVDARHSLEAMRDLKTGWVADKIRIIPSGPAEGRRFTVRVINRYTSPTNVGLDLLNLVETRETAKIGKV